MRGRGPAVAVLTVLVVALAAAPAAPAAEAPVDSFQVTPGPSKGTTGTVDLQAGVRYHLVVTGSASLSQGSDSSSNDAKYCFQSTSDQCRTPLPATDAIRFALRGRGGAEPATSSLEGIDRFGEATGASAPYSGAHRYEQFFTAPTGSRLFAMTWPGRVEGEGITYGGGFQVTVTRADCPASSAALRADTPACDPFRFGMDLMFRPPPPGKAQVTESPDVPEDVAAIRLRIRLEQAAATKVGAVTAVSVPGSGVRASDLVLMCVAYGLHGVRTAQIQIKKRDPDDPKLFFIVFVACVKLLGEEAGKPTLARAAGGGCPTTFVPVVPQGTRLSKAERRSLIAAAKSKVSASCSGNSTGRLSLTLRGRGATKLDAFTEPRVPLGIVRTPTPRRDGESARMVLRWTR
jgi:hypothetical protein